MLAAAVPPYLLKTADNPEGGLAEEDVLEMEQGARDNRAEFLDGFTTSFFSVADELAVTEPQRQQALALQQTASDEARVGSIGAFSRTDFRQDLARIGVPALVIHGNSDATVPPEVSGRRTADMVAGARLEMVGGGPQGLDVSHAEEFNKHLLAFLDD